MNEFFQEKAATVCRFFYSLNSFQFFSQIFLSSIFSSRSIGYGAQDSYFLIFNSEKGNCHVSRR